MQELKSDLHPCLQVLQTVSQGPQGLLAWQHHLQGAGHSCPLPSHKRLPILPHDNPFSAPFPSIGHLIAQHEQDY